MFKHRLVLANLAFLIAACSTSPPKPPTVDDSKKRPLNVSQAVALQVCRSELAATRIVLTETLSVEQRRQAYAALSPASFAPASSAEATPNHVFVVNFPLGSADLTITAEQTSRLVSRARSAKFIVIRGRTDATSDSIGETRLAQRRAEAAYRLLVSQGQVRPEGVRLSWQGAGDPIQAGDRNANRRVEIELYQVKPEIEVLTSSDGALRASRS